MRRYTDRRDVEFCYPINARNAECAARGWVDFFCARYASWPNEVDVDIRDEATGEVTRWTVEIRTVPEFIAKPRKPS